MRLILIVIMTIFSLVLDEAWAADWPERGITLVSALPMTVPWGTYKVNPQLDVLRSLAPRLSRELGVPVNIIEQPKGGGVLGGNMLSGAPADGYLVALLPPGAAMTRVIQGYTPYTWDEITPVATAWLDEPAIVVRADLAATDLRSLAASSKDNRPRLAYTKSDSFDFLLLTALEAARAAGFSWKLTEVDRFDPEILLEDRADAMVIPLSWFISHPKIDQFKVVTVLTQSDHPACADGLPTLKSQGLEVRTRPLAAFYLPAKVNWQARNRLSIALNRALSQKSLVQKMTKLCLDSYIEDLEGSVAVLNHEYQQESILLKELPLY